MPPPGEAVCIGRRLTEFGCLLFLRHGFLPFEQVVEQEHGLRSLFDALHFRERHVRGLDELGVHGDGKKRGLIHLAARDLRKPGARAMKETVACVERQPRLGPRVGGSRPHPGIIGERVIPHVLARNVVHLRPVVRVHLAVVVVALARQPAVVVVRISMEGQRPLLLAGQALDAARAGPGVGQRGQEQGREQRDNGDNHEQLDEREGGAAAAPGSATVPVAPAGVSPAGPRPTHGTTSVTAVRPGEVLDGPSKTGGETRRAPIRTA